MTHIWFRLVARRISGVRIKPMSGEKFDHSIHSWMTAADAAFVERMAEAEATTSSGIIRRLVRMARYQAGAYQPQHVQPAE
jgi:hypothetical protein